MPSAIKRGVPTITWGTDNVMNVPSGAVIQSGKITPKNGAPFELEDNNGFAFTAVMLDDGFDASVTLIHDSAKSWPDLNANVVMSLPKWGGNGYQSYNTFVGATPEEDMERKREATITYKLIYRPGIA